MSPLKESYTGEKVTDMLLSCLESWGIPRKKIHLVVRDNARNMEKGLKDASIPSLRCYVHTVQLVMNYGLKAQQSVTDIISNCRKIVGYLRHFYVAHDPRQSERSST